VKLSVVDQCPVPAGFTPGDALRNTIDLAQLAERLGYERYWIAEHHATSAFASPAPEVILPLVGAATSKMHIGSGGVMLPHYSPMKVAEEFRVLHALYPGRIDLGVGRAPGGSPLDTFALRRDRKQTTSSDDFPQQLMELLAFLHHGFRDDHPFSRIDLSPEMPGSPEVWLLGSSPWSASAAAQVGLPYAFAHFIDPTHTRMAIEHYQKNFIRSEAMPAPRTVLAVGAICADTETEADRIAMSGRLLVRRFRTGGGRGPVPTPEEASAELGADRSDPWFGQRSEFPRSFVGDSEQVSTRIIDMASQFGVDEVMIVTVVHDHQARRRSHELLAQAFNLTPRTPA
jgi:luciferase family oxidoreductase group 1